MLGEGDWARFEMSTMAASFSSWVTPLSLPVVGAVCLEAKLPEFAIHRHARHRLSVVDRILRGLGEETLLLLGVPGCQAGGAHHLHGCTCIHLMHLAIAKAPLLRWLQELPSQQLAMLFGSLDNDVSTPVPSPHQHGSRACHGRRRTAGLLLVLKVHQVGRKRSGKHVEMVQGSRSGGRGHHLPAPLRPALVHLFVVQPHLLENLQH